MRSAYDDKLGNIYLGSKIDWCKPSVDPRESKWVPSIDLTWSGHHDLDAALKSPTIFAKEIANFSLFQCSINLLKVDK